MTTPKVVIFFLSYTISENNLRWHKVRGLLFGTGIRCHTGAEQILQYPRHVVFTSSYSLTYYLILVLQCFVYSYPKLKYNGKRLQEVQ
jgi:hypothetical protein